jgi:hypothetical protein
MKPLDQTHADAGATASHIVIALHGQYRVQNSSSSPRKRIETCLASTYRSLQNKSQERGSDDPSHTTLTTSREALQEAGADKNRKLSPA